MGSNRNLSTLNLHVLQYVGFDGYMTYNGKLVRYFELDIPDHVFSDLTQMFPPDEIIIHWSEMLQISIHDFLLMLCVDHSEDEEFDDVCLNIRLTDFLGARECILFKKLSEHIHDDCEELLDDLFPDQMLRK